MYYKLCMLFVYVMYEFVHWVLHNYACVVFVCIGQRLALNIFNCSLLYLEKVTY